MSIDPHTSTVFDGLLRERRSIRKYKADTPPAEWIEGMLRAAAQAPSPSNSQPVRFVRIRSREKQNRLYQSLEAGRNQLIQKLETTGGRKRIKNHINTYYRYSTFMFDAPLLFAAGTVDSCRGFSRKLFEAGLLRNDHRRQTDADITVGLALKGFILKARAYGLGTCILTAPLAFIPNIEKILEIDDLRIVSLVTAGFPAETPAALSKKKPSEIYREI